MNHMQSCTDDTDVRLLDTVQLEFPVCQEPYQELGRRLGCSGTDVMHRIERLRSEGVIRQISAIFDSAALGYKSTLVAFRVRQDRLDAVAQAVAAHAGVSHCYEREASYNLWFTLTVAPGGDMDRVIMRMDRLPGVEASMVLPAIRVFKIGVYFRLSDGSGVADVAPGLRPAEAVALSDDDRAAVRALQRDLPLTPRPFDDLARREGLTGEDIIARARRFLREGTMRRYAAVLRHTRVGYRANAMVCWSVPRDDVGRTGPILAANPAVSHCYERPPSDDWPYSVYTMVHARTESELCVIVNDLSSASGITDYTLLRTLKEYKKSRVLYFEKSGG